MTDRPKNIRELKESGYTPISVKSELRRNLLARLRENRPLFPGIRGYDETVIPEIQNAILSQHDMLFLGLRGQGKTRMLRMLVELLDEAAPVVAGSEINDDPLAPLSKYARDRIDREGDDTPIEWAGREQRYHEKLATPDVTIADLIGEVDLIKHAEGRHLNSEDVMHFGLIPRSHRGIFCMNELPDLSPKIQVGLFNVLEERDVQIRGFAVRLPLDVCMVFSANPEDYTNRGRIVTPLKDRIGSVIRTHYPLSRDLGIQITEDNAWTERGQTSEVVVPNFIKQIVEESSRLARKSPHVNQASGVSVRMSVANFENVFSNAERRAALLNVPATVVRVSDLQAAVASSRGKVELNMTEESGEEDRLLQRIVGEAIKNIFDEHFKPKQFRPIVEHLENGGSVETGDILPVSEAVEKIGLDSIPGFRLAVETTATALEPDIASSPNAEELYVGIAELILEGLHCHNRCNKSSAAGQTKFGL